MFSTATVVMTHSMVARETIHSTEEQIMIRSLAKRIVTNFMVRRATIHSSAARVATYSRAVLVKMFSITPAARARTQLLTTRQATTKLRLGAEKSTRSR